MACFRSRDWRKKPAVRSLNNMAPLVQTVNQVLGALTVAGIIGIIAIATVPAVRARVAVHAYPLALVVAASAVLASLFYSEIAGFQPCSLCWWQRIFMFPQAAILAMALYERDRRVGDYLILLSGLGAIVAIYHAYLQYGGTPLGSCGTSAGAVSCAQVFVRAFGYITMPLMSLTAFALIGTLMLVKRRKV